MMPPGRWQRVVITALLVVPLVLVIGLSAPAWLALPFLSESRRKTVLTFLGCLIDWIRAIAGSPSVGHDADQSLSSVHPRTGAELRTRASTSIAEPNP